MNGRSPMDGSRTATARRWPLASMWLISRQAYSATRSAFSVHEMFV